AGAPMAPVPGSLKFAGVLPRLLAYWLDGFLVSIASLLVGLVIAAVVGLPNLFATDGSSLAALSSTSALINVVLELGLTFLYFVGFWTSAGRATPGMRLFHIQIGQAADGRALTVSQAALRWVALGTPISALAIVPVIGGLSGLISVVWSLVLFVSTATSDSRRGVHDNIAGTALVAPVGNEGPVVPCLVLFVLLLVVLPIIAVVALMAVAGQVVTILSQVGTSI
ncbi:MAG: RDD family protein, partial [Chloroflexota bacterium]